MNIIKSIAQEDIEQILGNNPFIKTEGWVQSPDGFKRLYPFIIRGQKYIIEWYINTCSLYCGELKVCNFQRIEYDGCCPNNFKNSLCFLISVDDSLMFPWRTIAVIPVEEF